MFLMRPVLFAVLLMLGGAEAEVRTELDWQSYPVQPEGAETLAQALDRSSPVRKRGLVYHATTQWQVQWRFWWQDSDRGCAIEGVQTEVSVQIQLPHWVAGADALHAEFEHYLSALTVHEQGHKDLAVVAGRSIDKALLELPPATDCATLERTANALGYQLLQRFRERENDYDRRTNHGQTQGAWLN